MKKKLLIGILSIAMLFSVGAFAVTAAESGPAYYVTDGFTVTQQDDSFHTEGSLADGNFAMVVNEPLKVQNGVSFDIQMLLDTDGTDMWNNSFARSVGFTLNTGDPSQVANFGPASNTATANGVGIQVGFAGMAGDYYNGTSAFYIYNAIGVNGTYFTSGHAGLNHPMIEHGAEVTRNMYEGTKGVRVTVWEDAEKYSMKFNALDESGNPQYESVYTSYTLVVYKEAGTIGGVNYPGFRYSSAPYLSLTAFNDPNGISGEEKNNDFDLTLSGLKNGLWDVFEVSPHAVKVGGTAQLVPEVTQPVIAGAPATVTYEYVSADPGVAEVDAATGVVTGKAGGETTITVTSSQGYSVVVPVTVTTLQHGLSIKNEAGKVLVRNNERQDTLQLEVEVVPNPESTFPVEDVTYSFASLDEEIATVDDTGLVTAVGSGTTDIVVTSNEGKTVQYTIKVNDGVAPEIQSPVFGAGLTQFEQMTLPAPAVTDNYDGVSKISAKITSPEYIVFEDASEDLTFTPEAYGTYKIVYTATDVGGLSSEFAATFDVKNKYDKSMDYYFGDTGEGLDSTRAIDIENGVRVLGDIRHGRSRLIVNDAIKTEYELTFDFTVDLLSPDDSYFNNGTDSNGNAIQVGIMLNESVRLSNGSLDYSYFYPNYTGWNGSPANGVQIVFKQFEKGGPVFMETFANGSLPLAYSTLREYGAGGTAVEAAIDSNQPVKFRCYEDDENKVYVIEMYAYTDSGLSEPVVLKFNYSDVNPENPENGFSTQPYLAMIASGYNFDSNYMEIPNGKYHHVDMAISDVHNTDVRGIYAEETEIDINSDYKIEVLAEAYPGFTLPDDIVYTFETSDPDLAEVSADGTIMPTWTKFGIVKITVRSNYGDVLEIMVTVNVKSVEIGTERLEIKVGETYQMTYTIDPDDIVPQWSSSNNTILKVDENGLITALKEGQASVTMTVGTEKLVCRVIVYPGEQTGDEDENEGGEVVEDPDSIDGSQEQTGCNSMLADTSIVLAAAALATAVIFVKKRSSEGK